MIELEYRLLGTNIESISIREKHNTLQPFCNMETGSTSKIVVNVTVHDDAGIIQPFLVSPGRSLQAVIDGYYRARRMTSTDGTVRLKLPRSPYSLDPRQTLTSLGLYHECTIYASLRFTLYIHCHDDNTRVWCYSWTRERRLETIVRQYARFKKVPSEGLRLHRFGSDEILNPDYTTVDIGLCHRDHLQIKQYVPFH